MYYITGRASDRSELMGWGDSPVYFAIGIIFSLLIFESKVSYVAVGKMYGMRATEVLPYWEND